MVGVVCTCVTVGVDAPEGTGTTEAVKHKYWVLSQCWMIRFHHQELECLDTAAYKGVFV